MGRLSSLYNSRHDYFSQDVRKTESSPQLDPSIDPNNTQVQPVLPSVAPQVRIGKISMFYGTDADVYERAIATHDHHARRHGYPMFVLRRQIQEGYWSKLLYMQSILVQELAKPTEERLQWLM
jgi:hypothetical protein